MSLATPVKMGGKDFWYVDEILDTRVHESKRQYLVHWTGMSPSNATWEPENNLKKLDLLKEFKQKHPEIEQISPAKGRKRKAPSTPAQDKAGSSKKVRRGKTPKTPVDIETENAEINFDALLKHLKSENAASLSKPEVEDPFMADRYLVFGTLTQQVSQDHASLLFPEEAEAADFFTNMPDFDTILQATQNTIIAANHSLIQTNDSKKRNMSTREDSLTSEMPASKKQGFVRGNAQVMAGFKDMPSSIAPRRVQAAASTPGTKAQLAKDYLTNIMADFEEFSYSREKRDHLISSFKTLYAGAKSGLNEEDSGLDWAKLEAEQTVLTDRAKTRKTNEGKNQLHRQVAEDMIDGDFVREAIRNLDMSL